MVECPKRPVAINKKTHKWAQDIYTTQSIRAWGPHDHKPANPNEPEKSLDGG